MDVYHLSACIADLWLPSSGNKSSIRFLVLGDWGGLPRPPYITPIEKATANMMAKTASQMGADFILALGDNFYYKGVTDVNDPRFQVWFLEFRSFKSQCRCFFFYLYILSDAFIQSDLQCIQAIHIFVSTCVPWESNPQTLRC